MEEVVSRLRNRTAILDAALRTTTWERWQPREKLIETDEGKIIALFETQADAIGMTTVHNDLPAFLQLVQETLRTLQEAFAARQTLAQIKGLLEHIEAQPLPAQPATPVSSFADPAGAPEEEPVPVPLIRASLGRQARQRSGLTEAFRTRFWKRVTLPEDRRHDHWYWTGQRNSAGLPFLQHNSVQIPAVWVAYELEIGPLQKHLVLTRACADSRCINPYHYLVSRSVESQVRENLTRITPQEFSPERLFELRSRYASGAVTDFGIAEEMGLPLSAVHRILEGVLPKKDA